MRISDWSSDVCSSDLTGVRGGRILHPDQNRLSGGLSGMTDLMVDAPPSGARYPSLAGKRVIVSGGGSGIRSEEHTSELQSLMRISYAVFCLKKKIKLAHLHTTI